MADEQENQDYQEQYEEGDENGDTGAEQPSEMTELSEGGEDAVAIGDDGTNEDDRKLFVGGLSWETTVKDLKEFFGKFGEVVSCTLKTDLETRRSRGFAFVVFNRKDVINAVLETEEELKLHGHKIEPKRANPRTGSRKIFVGRVDPACGEEDIKEYFTQFGKVEKVDLPFDKIKDQRRAFVFVEFDSEEAVKKVLAKEKHVLNGQEADIKKALPTQGPGGRGSGRGGRGRGGWNQGWGNGGYGNGGYGNYYGNYNYGPYGGYGGGYDYNQGYYGGWGGYDYNQGYGGYGGYDYSGWGYGQEQGQQPSNYGKSGTNKRGGGSNYHPYS